MYGMNLLGSGVGAVAAILLLEVAAPAVALVALATAAALSVELLRKPLPALLGGAAAAVGTRARGAG